MVSLYAICYVGLEVVLVLSNIRNPKLAAEVANDGTDQHRAASTEQSRQCCLEVPESSRDFLTLQMKIVAYALEQDSMRLLA